MEKEPRKLPLFNIDVTLRFFSKKGIDIDELLFLVDAHEIESLSIDTIDKLCCIFPYKYKLNDKKERVIVPK